jgi:hypothetical protein
MFRHRQSIVVDHEIPLLIWSPVGEGRAFGGKDKRHVILDIHNLVSGINDYLEFALAVLNRKRLISCAFRSRRVSES